MWGLNRLDGRFVWVSGILLLGLLIVSTYSHFQVQETSGESIQLIQDTGELNLLLVNIKETMQQTEKAVYQYSILLDDSRRDVIKQYVQQLREQTTTLTASPLLNSDKHCVAYSKDLLNAVADLEFAGQEYLQVMETVQNRYPGMPILLQYLEPANRRFSEAVEQALLEGTVSELRPGILEREQYQIQKLLEEIRYAWSQQISWVRIFVANRMGAFGSPESAMRQNLKNRAIYADTIKDLIRKLDIYDRQNKLGLQQSESLIAMKEAYSFYERYFSMAADVYLSKNWRTDTVVLQKKIQPAMDKAWESVKNIEDRVKEFSTQSLQKSQHTAETLSGIFWFFILISASLLWLGYVVFNRSIRKPVLQVAAAMEAEGRGEIVSADVDVKLQEIEHLVNAFSGMREQVHSRQQRLESILQNAADGIIILDSESRVELMNGAALTMFEYTEPEIAKQKFTTFLSPDKDQIFGLHSDTASDHNSIQTGKELELVGKRKDGSLFPLSFKASEMNISGKRLYTAIVSDISERKAVMEHLRHMAEHDALTGLFNRKHLLDELDRLVEKAKVSSNNQACLYIDLDNFKYLNDSLGHLQGDRMLVEVSEILKKSTRDEDVLARLGGDEFAILLTDVELSVAKEIAEGYRGKIANYMFHHEDKMVDIGASIGLAMLDTQSDDREQLLMHADIACHIAKSQGRNRVHVYRPSDQEQVDLVCEDMGWSQRIKQALEHSQFMFEYQKIEACDSQFFVGYEVLVRMLEQNGKKAILPGAFMGAAERFGIMHEIDAWVIQNICGKISKINPHSNGIMIFINLSATSISNPQILKVIKDCMERFSIPPRRVVFEITERVAFAGMNSTIDFINSVKALGCLTALDNFGTGYSSFSHLKDLPVDFVKIDGTYSENLLSNTVNQALVRSIVDVSHALGKHVVAESVADSDVLAILRELKVDYVQGQFIDGPDMLDTEAEQDLCAGGQKSANHGAY